MNKRSTTFKMILLSGTLSFSSIFAQNYEGLVSDYLHSDTTLNSKSLSSKEFIISNIDNSKSLKGDVLQVQQLYNSIPIYHGTSTFLVKNNKIEYVKENFISDFDSSKVKKIKKSTLDEKRLAESLLPSILLTINSKDLSNYKLKDNFNESESVDYKLVYFLKDNQLILAMEFNLEELNSSNYWHMLIDVETKEILVKENSTVFCEFDEGAFGYHDHSSHEHNYVNEYFSEKEEMSNQSLNINDATYNVFAFPVEAPTFGNRKLLKNPWDLTASPQGWQVINNKLYTITRGNNVYAYEDIKGINIPSYKTDGGSSLNFDFPLDINLPLETYKDAAITNLFYTNNKIHDVFYKFGFTEDARNFQEENFTDYGKDNDGVRAEARDGYDGVIRKSRNNANFYTPADGSRPRMQMFVWDPASPPQRIKFNSPAEFVGWDIKTQIAEFGPYSTGDEITGDLEKSLPTNGCSEFTNDLTDKIAFIERGSCNFTIKVKNAQIAGAKAAVIYNVNSDQPFHGMGGDDGTITIPSALITYEDGKQILSKLDNKTNVNLSYQDDKDKYNWIDASLDNGIIIHEYGHGISNRLTGDGHTCLYTRNSNEQMGEGWSDFFALMLTNRPGDNASVARGIGTFANAEQPNGLGIRPAKYSPDFAINNYTYGNTNKMNYQDSDGNYQVNVHSVGFVWATMLWDLHWKLVEQYGYSSDVLANPDSGSAKVLQLVVDGLKLQPCNPTFTDGRDAILAADKANGEKDRCLIWNVFAKRGLGVNADAGLKIGYKEGLEDQVEDFEIPADCKLSTNEFIDNSTTINIYPNPAKNEVNISSSIKEKVNIQIFDINGRKVLEKSEDISSGTTINTSSLSNGVYIIKGKGNTSNFTQKLIIKK